MKRKYIKTTRLWGLQGQIKRVQWNTKGDLASACAGKYDRRCGFPIERILSIFYMEGENQEELLYEILPVYTLFETRLNKKEHYIDLVEQCKAAVKKYPGSKKIFAMLAEVLEYMSEEIFEQYRTIQTLLWEQYVAVSAKMDEEVAYALAKACFYKAFLLEKYEDSLRKFEKEEYPEAYYAILRLNKRFERV